MTSEQQMSPANVIRAMIANPFLRLRPGTADSGRFAAPPSPYGRFALCKSKKGRAARRAMAAARAEQAEMAERERREERFAALPIERRAQLAQERKDAAKKRRPVMPPPSKLTMSDRKEYVVYRTKRGKGLFGRATTERVPVLAHGAIRVSRVTVVRTVRPEEQRAREARAALMNR